MHDVLGQAEHWITIASVGGPSTWWGPKIAHNILTLQGLKEIGREGMASVHTHNLNDDCLGDVVTPVLSSTGKRNGKYPCDGTRRS